MSDETCPFFDYPYCKLGADICIADKDHPETCRTYTEALESYEETGHNPLKKARRKR